MGKLDSKTIIITGGSLGIGFAIANKCAEEGAKVIIIARNKGDLANSLSKLSKNSNRNHISYSLNVGDFDAIKEFTIWLKGKNLEINGLVNCAGIYGPIGKTTQVDMRKFTEAVQINFLGSVYMCNSIAPLMKSNSRKKIINYSGGGAATPFPYYSAYATSKIAIVRFTENLSIELFEDNFDINCVAPGFVITRLHQETLKAGLDKAGKSFFTNTKKQIESGGVPPEKTVDLTLFLLSKDSDGITGKFISAPWDPWQSSDFQQRIKIDQDFATLRRIDDKIFFKKNSV